MGLCCGTESLTRAPLPLSLDGSRGTHSGSCPQCPHRHPKGDWGLGATSCQESALPNPHFTLCSFLCLFGAGPVRPGPACLPGRSRKLENFPWQLKTRFRYPSCQRCQHPPDYWQLHDPGCVKPRLVLWKRSLLGLMHLVKLPKLIWSKCIL